MAQNYFVKNQPIYSKPITYCISRIDDKVYVIRVSQEVTKSLCFKVKPFFNEFVGKLFQFLNNTFYFFLIAICIA